MAEQGPSNPETVSEAPQELAAVARSPLRRLIVHFVHFLTGNALTMLLGLITFPILTRLLPRDEYGVLGLVTTTISIAVALAKGGLSDGIIRFYRDFAGSPERLQVFTSTVIVRGVLLSALVCALYGLAIPLIAQQLGIDRRFLICFYVMLPYLFVRPLNIIVLNYYRALGLTWDPLESTCRHASLSIL